MMNKQFLLVRNLVKPLGPLGKQKKCRNCDSLATKEALFDVGNDISVVERYCESCVSVLLKDRGSVA